MLVDKQGNTLPKSMDGKTVQIDHVENTFVLTVSSLSGVSWHQVKDLIQQKFKVVDIEEQGEPTTVVRV
jgi:predicted transcriptional regulator